MPDIASPLFDLWGKYNSMEWDVGEAVLRALGVDVELTETWPCQNWWFDDYDSSCELGDCTPGWTPTRDQLEAVWALGFGQLWLNYTDGTALHASRGHSKFSRSHHSTGGSGLTRRRARLRGMIVEAKAHLGDPSAPDIAFIQRLLTKALAEVPDA